MIEVTHYYGVHQGASKDYHVYLFFSKATNATISVKRFGKKDSNGQVKIELVRGNGDVLLDKALKERAKKGYDMRLQPGRQFTTAAEALKVLPPQHQRSISNAQLATIDPLNHSAGDKSSHDPIAEQRAGMVAEMQRKAREEQEAQAKAQAEEEQEALKSNPMYGMF